MGYYVTLTRSTFTIPTDNLDDCYKALCALNATDSHKTGGRWGGTPTPKPADSKSVAPNPDRFFAWMHWNYDEICTTAQEIFEALDFSTELTDDGLLLSGYDSKSGNEEVFLSAAAPFAVEGSELLWVGEEGEMWCHKVVGGVLRDAHVSINVDVAPVEPRPATGQLRRVTSTRQVTVLRVRGGSGFF